MRGTLHIALFGVLVVSAALPFERAKGGSLRLLEEQESADPVVPVRGAEQAQANADALKIDHQQQEQEDEEAKERAQNAMALSKSVSKMASTKSIDTAINEMDADKQPIDIMAGKYKSLAITSSSTPKSVAAAEAHEIRVGAMERKMKQQAQKHNKMLEDHTHKQVPTLDGMQQAIKTTIDANMKEQLSKLPYPGEQKWDDVLPSTNDFYKPWKGNKEYMLPLKKAENEKDASIDAENAMLTQRQNAIANQEKHVEEEKDMLKSQMVKVMAAASHVQEEYQEEEDQTKARAQKKVHDANFAMAQMMRMTKNEKMNEYKEHVKASKLKNELGKAIAQKMIVQKAAAHELMDAKRKMGMMESLQLQALKKKAQHHIHAMARAASKIAKRLYQAQDRIQADKSEIKYLKSKVELLRRQDQRQREELSRNIEKRESKFWNQQLTKVEKQAMADKSSMTKQLLKEQTAAAKVARSALNSQKAIQALKMPLEAQKLAKRLGDKDQKDIKKLNSENFKLKAKVKHLENELKHANQKIANQAAALTGKDKANGNLVQMIRKVNEKKVEAEDAAQANAAKVEIEHQRLVDKNETLDVSKSGAVDEYYKLLATPCTGEACDSIDNHVENVPTLVNPNVLFPELTTVTTTAPTPMN